MIWLPTCVKRAKLRVTSISNVEIDMKEMSGPILFRLRSLSSHGMRWSVVGKVWRQSTEISTCPSQTSNGAHSPHSTNSPSMSWWAQCAPFLSVSRPLVRLLADSGCPKTLLVWYEIEAVVPFQPLRIRWRCLTDCCPLAWGLPLTNHASLQRWTRLSSRATGGALITFLEVTRRGSLSLLVMVASSPRNKLRISLFP
jgi:hypothetical protein